MSREDVEGREYVGTGDVVTGERLCQEKRFTMGLSFNALEPRHQNRSNLGHLVN